MNGRCDAPISLVDELRRDRQGARPADADGQLVTLLAISTCAFSQAKRTIQNVYLRRQPMKFVFRTLALTRYLTLRSQLKDLERAIGGLSLDQKRALFALAQKEFSNAAAAPVPHLYASENAERYSPWGNGTAIAQERMRSDNLPLKLRGIALWLAVTYHETKDLPYGEMQDMHRMVQRCIRLLRESLGNAGNTEINWGATKAA